MLTTDNCFRWNIEVTLVSGEKIDFLEWSGDIYELRIILEKYEVSKVSYSTLYRMKKPQDRVYSMRPLFLVEIPPAHINKIISIANVAEWHLKIGRKR